MISIVAIPTILATRWLAEVHHPELFVNTLPTISKAAAYPAASALFSTGMTFASACIVAFWPLAWLARRDHIDRTVGLPKARFRLTMISTLAALTGMSAGIFLGGLSLISLEDNDPLHVLLSILFFSAQVAAFLLDTFVLARLHRCVRRQPDLPPPGHSGRFALTVLVVILAVIFLLCFIYKGTGGFTDTMAMRKIYVGSELILSICCLLYPSAAFPELRNFSQIRETPFGSGDGTARVLEE